MDVIRKMLATVLTLLIVIGGTYLVADRYYDIDQAEAQDSGKRFIDTYELEGDRLKRPPKGFDPDHPLVEDLKRKDFIGVAKIPKKLITSPDLPEELAKVFGAATPLMKFLCEAVSVPF